MDHPEIGAPRERHTAWRWLRAGNASLALSLLGESFADARSGRRRGALPPRGRFSYLDDWSTPGAVTRGASDIDTHAARSSDGPDSYRAKGVQVGVAGDARGRGGERSVGDPAPTITVTFLQLPKMREP